MINKFKLFIITVMVSIVFAPLGFSQAQIPERPSISNTSQAVVYTSSLEMVANPLKYLNKTVTVKGKFDKFSTLGLDYPPAMRSSEDYITFLIQRDDVKDHNVPLSEMKVFLKRTEAEKHIELNAGDVVQFTGKVFSNALGDVWVDANTFKVLNKKDKK